MIRLHGLTGGLPAVAKYLCADIPFEENLKILLKHDSAFSHFAPSILQRLFRSPESYHPILYSIACGKHRLSEIAKDIGFPNNKCGKYLEALIKAGLVKAHKESENSFARYFLTNSYIKSWYLYIYKNRMLQITNPQGLLNKVILTMDKAIALPSLEESCIRFIDNKYQMIVLLKTTAKRWFVYFRILSMKRSPRNSWSITSTSAAAMGAYAARSPLWCLV